MLFVNGYLGRINAFIVLGLAVCFFCAPAQAASPDFLNGRWRIHPQRTEEVQPSPDTHIMQYKTIFDRMYIDIKLYAKTITFGIEGTEPDVSAIEDIQAAPEGEYFILYIDHDPVRLTPLGGGLLRFEEENSGTYLVLIKQLL